jgi:hypothetical protein
MMYGHEKSDRAIVAGKPTNKAERSAAELVERRAGTEGNAGQVSTRRTLSRVSVTKGLARIRQLSAVDTQGGSRMRESRTYGSARGARGNSCPYRKRRCRFLAHNDRPPFSGRPSLTGHCGHGCTCRWFHPVAIASLRDEFTALRIGGAG